MKTKYIIQKRHPNLRDEWPLKHWHDRSGSPEYSDKIEAIFVRDRFIHDAETTEYRLIERVEKVIPVKQNTPESGA